MKRFLFLAICLSPLQYAFTLSVGGSPLKLSEMAILLACLCLPFIRWSRLRGPGTLPMALLAFLVFLSSVFNLLREDFNRGGVLRGFTREPQDDLMFYAALGIFTLIAWKMMSTMDRGRIEKAVVLATWVCATATLTQILGIVSGSYGLLEALGFESEGSAENFFLPVSTRNGPFLEGQQLGFFCGFALLVCVYRRAWLAAIAAFLCILYSQSTTAVVGVAVAILAVLLFRFNLKVVFFLLVAGGAAGIALAMSERLQGFVAQQFAKLGLFGVSGDFGGATQSLSIRGTKTNIAWDMMLDHPMAGVGPGRYSVEAFSYPEANNLPDYYFRSDHRTIAENLYAQIGSELGLLALLAFCLFLVILLRRVLKQRDAGLLAVLAYAAAAIWTQSSWTFLPIWVAFALLASSGGSDRRGGLADDGDDLPGEREGVNPPMPEGRGAFSLRAG
jgi:O-antigen ligase